MVSPAIPASRDAFSLAPTYTALAGSSPTSTTLSPGVTPRAFSAATSAATSARIFFASSVPLISCALAITSAGKVHRPCLADQHHLDLSGILQLGLDAPRDLLRQRRHASVVHVIRH